MELNKIKEVRELIGIQIALSLKDVGTKQMYKLCIIASDLDKLIKLLENPKEELKDKRLERLMNGK